MFRPELSVLHPADKVGDFVLHLLGFVFRFIGQQENSSPTFGRIRWLLDYPSQLRSELNVDIRSKKGHLGILSQPF